MTNTGGPATSRTYPNLMTVEGIRGDETSPSNELTLTYLFTRMIAGRADHTVCWTDKRVQKNATHAYQLAKPVCFFSPWQFLFWYDRPAAIARTPELEFFRKLPTTWDETRVLYGRMGECAVMARRSRQEWYVGCMNGSEARTVELDFAFLPANQPYVAWRYQDDPSLSTKTRVRIDQLSVTALDKLTVELPPRGGQVLHLQPVTEEASTLPD